MLASTIREGAERWLGIHEGELGRDFSVVTSESENFLVKMMKELRVFNLRLKKSDKLMVCGTKNRSKNYIFPFLTF